MTKVILTGPFPTPEEAADQLGLTYKERVNVNKVLREMRKEEPRVQLLPVKVKRGAQRAQTSEHAKSSTRRAAAS